VELARIEASNGDALLFGLYSGDKNAPARGGDSLSARAAASRGDAWEEEREARALGEEDETADFFERPAFFFFLERLPVERGVPSSAELTSLVASSLLLDALPSPCASAAVAVAVSAAAPDVDDARKVTISGATSSLRLDDVFSVKRRGPVPRGVVPRGEDRAEFAALLRLLPPDDPAAASRKVPAE
jgi:hypothetical protein